MKTKQSIFKYVCAVGLGLVLSMSCSSDDTAGEPPGSNLPEDGELVKSDGISEDELETFMGEIGLLLDARPYIRKGQPIAKVKVTPTDSDFFEPMVLEVDPFTNYASFKLSLENLPSEAETALRNGINLEVDLLDENDNELFKEILENTLFTENGSNVELRGDDAEDLNTEVHLKPDTPYFLQLVSEDGEIEDKVLDNEPNLGLGVNLPDSGSCLDVQNANDRLPTRGKADFRNVNKSQQFYFQKHEGEDNVYSIISVSTNTYLQTVTDFANIVALGTNTSKINKTASFQSLDDIFKFKIEKVNGSYELKNYSTNRSLAFRTTDVRLCSTGGLNFVGYQLTGLADTSNGQNFRIVTTDVEYEAQSIETWYGQPILPAAENSFKFNSTLTNCTSKDLVQEIIIDLKESTTMSLSWEETIGFTAGITSTTSMSVGAEAGVNFFGNGGKVSGTVTQELELTVEISKSSTIAEGKSSTTENSLLTSRTVTVAPSKQVLAYDAVQTYPDIKVPFVQRFKITGRNSDGVALSGYELATQSAFGGFTGTITEIGTSSIEITVRGTTTFKQAVDATSEAFESNAVCN